MMTFILVYPFGTFRQFNYETNINKRDSVHNVCQDVRISKSPVRKLKTFVKDISWTQKYKLFFYVKCSKSNYRRKVSKTAFIDKYISLIY